VNDLLWVTLQATDLERSRSFWRDIVGLPEKYYSPGWVELELKPGVHLALHSVFHAAPFEKRGYDRGGPVLGIRVDSLEEMGALVERGGAMPLSPAQDIPGGRSRDFEDPDGYVFELIQLVPAEATTGDAATGEGLLAEAPPVGTPPG
jgi:catechol 2,3-dioxygenase-like lactoylglutathione lyase family enzyme